MNKKTILKEFKRILKNESFERSMDDEGNEIYSNYLGSFLSLDPCGKYHNVLSPNGIKKSCENFWERFNECAESLNCWIGGSEGDGLDVLLYTEFETLKHYNNKHLPEYSYPDEFEIEEGYIINDKNEMFHEGKFIAENNDINELFKIAKSMMKKENYYTPIYVINCHGNLSIYDCNGKYLEGWV